MKDGSIEYGVQDILNHKKRGRRYLWLTLLRGDPLHEATWPLTRDFMDTDGIVTEQLIN